MVLTRAVIVASSIAPLTAGTPLGVERIDWPPPAQAERTHEATQAMS